jgi:hypothetical protein
LLTRGGTSTVGLTAAAMAKDLGATVLATTRRPERAQLLRTLGVDHPITDDGTIAVAVRDICPDGVDAALELTGTRNLYRLTPVGRALLPILEQIAWVSGSTDSVLVEPALVRSGLFGHRGRAFASVRTGTVLAGWRWDLSRPSADEGGRDDGVRRRGLVALDAVEDQFRGLPAEGGDILAQNRDTGFEHVGQREVVEADQRDPAVQAAVAQ